MRLPGFQREIKPKRRREIYDDVAELSRPSGSYYVMMALSTIIAAYGLLIDSAAVVVGAMLVAPLMGPIFGIALALASGNRRLLWPSLQSEGFGILIAVGVGALIGVAPLSMPMVGAEWLVRTQPTLHDLAIALASGLAGAYALVDDRVSPALPGVAIAVAVLPPLAACGLGIAAGSWDTAIGAGMLFVANFFAIQIAAAVVFSAFGMLRVERHPRSRPEEEEGIEVVQFFKRFWVSILVLLVMGAFMTRTLVGLAVDRQLSATIESTLKASVGTISGARISETGFQRSQGQLRVTAHVLTPRPFETDQVASMEEELENTIDQEVHLIVRSLISRDMDREGTVFTSPEDEQLKAEEQERRQFLQHASEVISSHLAEIPGAELTDVQRSSPNGITTVTAIVRAPEAIGPEPAATIEKALRRRLSTPVKVVIRTVLIAEADAEKLLHVRDGVEEANRRAALASNARTVLNSWLERNVEGAVIDEIEVISLEPIRAVAMILSSRALTAEEAAAMKDTLDAAVEQDVTLTVRYGIGGTVEASIEEPAEEDSGEAAAE